MAFRLLRIKPVVLITVYTRLQMLASSPPPWSHLLSFFPLFALFILQKPPFCSTKRSSTFLQTGLCTCSARVTPELPTFRSKSDLHPPISITLPLPWSYPHSPHDHPLLHYYTNISSVGLSPPLKYRLRTWRVAQLCSQSLVQALALRKRLRSIWSMNEMNDTPTECLGWTYKQACSFFLYAFQWDQGLQCERAGKTAGEQQVHWSQKAHAIVLPLVPTSISRMGKGICYVVLFTQSTY